MKNKPNKKEQAEALKFAKEIMEDKSRGMVLIAKLTETKDGFGLSVTCDVNDVPRNAQLTTIAKGFELNLGDVLRLASIIK